MSTDLSAKSHLFTRVHLLKCLMQHLMLDAMSTSLLDIEAQHQVQAMAVYSINGSIWCTAQVLGHV